MKKIILLLLLVTASASAQLPKVGRMHKLVIDTLYSVRVDSLSDAMRTQTSRIDLITGSITLTVTDSMFNALEGRVFTNEGQIAIFDTAIASRVTHIEYDAFGDTLAAWGTDIRQDVNSITLAVNGKADTSSITILENSISLKADTTYVLGLLSAQTISADHITDGALGAGVTVDAKVIFRAINGDFADSTTIDGSHIATGTLTADKIYGDTLTGVVISGVNITGVNLRIGTPASNEITMSDDGEIGFRWDGAETGTMYAGHAMSIGGTNYDGIYVTSALNVSGIINSATGVYMNGTPYSLSTHNHDGVYQKLGWQGSATIIYDGSGNAYYFDGETWTGV